MSSQQPVAETDKTKVDFAPASSRVEEFAMYPDKPTHKAHKDQMQIKLPLQYYDPCAELAQMLLQCLDRNNYDKTMCGEYFLAYRECKKAWMEERKKDRAKGYWW